MIAFHLTTFVEAQNRSLSTLDRTSKVYLVDTAGDRLETTVLSYLRVAVLQVRLVRNHHGPPRGNRYGLDPRRRLGNGLC